MNEYTASSIQQFRVELKPKENSLIQLHRKTSDFYFSNKSTWKRTRFNCLVLIVFWFWMGSTNTWRHFQWYCRCDKLIARRTECCWICYEHLIPHWDYKMMEMILSLLMCIQKARSNGKQCVTLIECTCKNFVHFFYMQTTSYLDQYQTLWHSHKHFN